MKAMRRRKGALTCAMLLACTGASAQKMTLFDGVNFHKFSPDGNWLVENLAGTMSVLSAKTGEKYDISDPNAMEMYSPGLGQSVTNSGKICGFTMNKGAFIWDNGVMKDLPEPSGIGTSFNGAQAFTPDESCIVGALGSDGASLGADGLSCYPVIWKKNAQGAYECHALPYLAKDFSGGTPQSVIATVVADDGHIAAGTLTSWNGFYTFPILFKEDADGNWTYKLLGKSDIYDESKLAELPDMPVEPQEPNYEDYMSEADKAAYQEALEIYEEELENYNNGLTTEEPTYPTPDEYISDLDRRMDYVAAVEDYVAKHKAYMVAWKKYSAALDKIVTGAHFTKNNIILSANGRYLASSLVHDGITTPGYFDLQEEDPQFIKATDNHYSMLTTGILNDGTILAASPVTELTRSTFVIGKDTQAPVCFHDYLATRSQVAAKWLADNNTYNVTIYGDDGETVVSTKKDSIISGTVSVSGDANVFVSYYTDYSSASQTKKSFVIDLSEVSAINDISASHSPLQAQLSGKSLLLSASVKQATVCDMSGRIVSRGSSALLMPETPGMYIVNMKGRNGEEKSEKIIIQ